MSIELESDTSCLPNWALPNGIWNGRQVSRTDASEFQKEIHLLALHLLEKQGEDAIQMAAQLACLGTSAPGQSLFAHEIQALDFSKNDLIVQAGLHKSASKFWKKHKKEILIGAAIIALVAVVVIVSLSTAGTGTWAVAAAGGAALDAAIYKEKKEPDRILHRIKPNPPPKPSIDLDSVLFDEIPTTFSVPETKEIEQLQELIPDIPQTTWITYFLSNLGKDLDNPDLGSSMPSPEISSRFTIPGKVFSDIGVGGINGIATKMQEAVAHAEYLAKLANGHSIDWVYNRSHGHMVDLAEVISMNYLSFSPNTSDLLQETWRDFDLKNRGNPEAKYLQFCHSQGAIHVRNALEKLPKEIRERVIVIAIAPAVVVSKGLCYDSHNYVSKNDILNYGELFWAASLDSNECKNSKKVEWVLELRNQLILLDPHPDAAGIDHAFQSPTFREHIIRHLNDHIIKKGKYK